MRAGLAAPVGVLGGVGAGLADRDHHADPVLLPHAEAGQPAAEPAAHPGQRRRDGDQVQPQRLHARPRAGARRGRRRRRASPAGAAHPLGDRGRQPGRARRRPARRARASTVRRRRRPAAPAPRPGPGRCRRRRRWRTARAWRPARARAWDTGASLSGRLPSGGRGARRAGTTSCRRRATTSGGGMPGRGVGRGRRWPASSTP